MAFDRLAASLDRIYLTTLAPYILDPWELRNRYIDVLLEHCKVEELIFEMSGHVLDRDVIRQIALLLEAQRQRQRMFTSCGWFFEDFNRIEPKNNVAYAAQMVRLVKLATGEDLSQQAIADLKHVVSHRTGLRGDTVFQRQLRRAREGR